MRLSVEMSLSESFNKTEMTGLVARFKQLDRAKRSVLLQVLEKLEKGDVGTFQSSLEGLEEAKPEPRCAKTPGTRVRKPKVPTATHKPLRGNKLYADKIPFSKSTVYACFPSTVCACFPS